MNPNLLPNTVNNILPFIGLRKQRHLICAGCPLCLSDEKVFGSLRHGCLAVVDAGVQLDRIAVFAHLYRDLNEGIDDCLGVDLIRALPVRRPPDATWASFRIL